MSILDGMTLDDTKPELLRALMPGVGK